MIIFPVMCLLMKKNLWLFLLSLVALNSGCGSSDSTVPDGNIVDSGSDSSDGLGTDAGNMNKVTHIATGRRHNCALFHNNTVKCWGQNFSGNLGLGDTEDRGDDAEEMGENLPFINFGLGKIPISLHLGEGTSCARFNDGTIKCWGQNGRGELGLEDTNNRGWSAGQMGDSLPSVNLGTGRSVVHMVSGASHSCAILDNSTVKCWGQNFDGQLGLGNTDHYGDNTGEMGDNLPTVDLGSGRTAESLYAGYGHTCAILDNGAVKCWGRNFNGQLGLGDFGLRGDQPGEMGDNLPAIDLGTGRTAIMMALSSVHSCALLDNGDVKCWGENENGQLGLEDDIDRGYRPGEMGDNLPAIDLGTGRTAVSINTGLSHTCALLDNGDLKCWGRNGAGQLGRGNTFRTGDDPGDMGDNLRVVDLGIGENAVLLSLGLSAHNCVLLNNSEVKCWGSNGVGELGLEDTNNRGDNSDEMGDNLPSLDL